MVTKIINNSKSDVVFYTPNIKAVLGDPKATPIKRVVRAGETAYSRSVTGDEGLEAFLKSRGCELSQVRRSYIVVVAGQSNAVGYDESPHKPSDNVPLPFCYSECLYPTSNSGYKIGDQVPIVSAYVDSFQNMRTQVNQAGQVTKGIHRYLAERLISLVPEGYELEVFSYAQGGSGVVSGTAGSVGANNLPNGSTLWNANGALTQAFGKRLNAHFATTQPESKLLAIVWCLGEFDGQANVSVTDFETAFKATINKIKELAPALKPKHFVNPAWQIDTEADGEIKRPLWFVYAGPQKFWNTKGTFKQIIKWYKNNFTNFIDLPEDLPTNDSNKLVTGTDVGGWRGWRGYGFTSSLFASHYAGCFDYIGEQVAKQIANQITNAVIKEVAEEVVTPPAAEVRTKLFDTPTFAAASFKVWDGDTLQETFNITDHTATTKNITPVNHAWEGSSNITMKWVNNSNKYNFIIEEGVLKIWIADRAYKIYKGGVGDTTPITATRIEVL